MVTKFTHTQYDTWKCILKQIQTEVYEESKEFQETEFFLLYYKDWAIKFSFRD